MSRPGGPKTGGLWGQRQPAFEPQKSSHSANAQHEHGSCRGRLKPADGVYSSVLRVWTQLRSKRRKPNIQLSGIHRDKTSPSRVLGGSLDIAIRALGNDMDFWSSCACSKKLKLTTFVSHIYARELEGREHSTFPQHGKDRVRKPLSGLADACLLGGDRT
ncbi:uncharacterized protein BP01DRAFT_369995 [Aspergillus saccharolyticus JOP 1030-1]|uniref:Uncharacterized protein n=1 Tax=Aspergillus saccharolyticus JOP 1030-1 TaxID=1450539 RepID=A0A318ZJ62_9EURO|nr:hypothetical protein BP01DRAFT_369995 [Aspergillus saccharolyticus JOP 1030-1]PYH40298.1 hypothetical protein BP01DRAFT_369995 [Aspergillus saccharolyticus JOP 1030-1]